VRASGVSGRRTPAEIGPTDPDVAAANRYGLVLAALFGLVGLLLLVLAAIGRGWSFLLGAVDFLVIAAVLAWALREGRARNPA
jgi:hypothetical protein